MARVIERSESFPEQVGMWKDSNIPCGFPLWTSHCPYFALSRILQRTGYALVSIPLALVPSHPGEK